MHTTHLVHAGYGSTPCSPAASLFRRRTPTAGHNVPLSCLNGAESHSHRLHSRHALQGLVLKPRTCKAGPSSVGLHGVVDSSVTVPAHLCEHAVPGQLTALHGSPSISSSAPLPPHHATGPGSPPDCISRDPKQQQRQSTGVRPASTACGCSKQSDRLRHQAPLCMQHDQHLNNLSSNPPAPWGLAGARGLPLPPRYRTRLFAGTSRTVHSSRRNAVRVGAFVGAATGPGTAWHQALGLSARGVLWGIAFTLGSQLLMAIVLRTLWAQRAIAALESWLQTVFGLSIRRGAGSAENSMDEDDETDDAEVAMAGLVRAMSSSSNSSSTSVGTSGSTGSEDSTASFYSRRKKKARAAERAARQAALVEKSPGESVEWVNMCFRKIWHVYQRGLERWVSDLLQPVFDSLVEAGSLPTWLIRLRIVELTFDHSAPYFSNMRRRNSRKDSDLTGVVDARYTGGARMLLMLELGQGRWRFKIPVLVSDLDLQCALWLKLRLAPMCPWIGTISLAFVGPPAVKVQLSPYNRVRLMRIPVLQNLLNRLLTVDLPALMVLPERLEISVPPSVTSIAEAAVGRDTIMRAVASAVLQVDSLEQALLAALPLGPQAAAGGVSLPDFFRGELTVLLREGRDLAVWGMPWQSNPWVRLVLGDQAVASRRDSETSTKSRHGSPVWNQEVQFLVEDPEKQVLEIYVNDSHLTGRPKVGKAVVQLKDLPLDGHSLSLWVPLDPVNPGQTRQGEVLLDVTFKQFEDDEQDSGYREAQEYARTMQQQSEQITDIRSAAAASSRAAVAASAAISAIAMTKAAAARAAARAAQAAQAAGAAALNTAAAALPHQQQQQSADQQLLLPPPAGTLTEDQKKQIAAAAGKKAAADKKTKRRQRDDDRGPPSGGNGTTAAADEEAAAAEAAAAAKRREEALIEALEARMDFKVRRTGTPRSQSPLPSMDGRSLNNKSLDLGGSAPAGGKGALRSVDLPDMSVTLPADSSSSSYSSLDEEKLAVERAERAVADILDKSRRMEAAVAELVELTAGSPTEAALQQGAVKAAEQAATAISGLTQAATAAATAPVVEKENKQKKRADAAMAVPANGGNGSSSSSGGGSSNGVGGHRDGSTSSSSSRHRGFGSFASGYSIWGEDQLDRNRKPDKTQQQQQRESGSSDYTMWGEDAVEQQQQHLPSVVVSVSDGDLVKSEVVGGAGQSTPPAAAAAAENLRTVVDADPAPPEPVITPVSNSVRAAMTDRSAAAAITEVAGAAAAGSTGQQQQGGDRDLGQESWWSKVIFWLPGQKSAESANLGSTADASLTSLDVDSGDQPVQSIDSAVMHPEPISTAQRAWWQPLLDSDFVKSLPGIKQPASSSSSSKAAGEDTTTAAADQPDQQQQDSGKQKNWWDLDINWEWLPRFGGSVDDEESIRLSASGNDKNKPVGTIVIPADLPLEEIAKEVAKLKEDAWRSKEDHLESLWAKTVERNDRSWLMLLCFLLTVVIGLLAIVAYRIANVQSTGDVGAVVDAAAVVAQLPLLLTMMVAAVGVTYLGGGL